MNKYIDEIISVVTKAVNFHVLVETYTDVGLLQSVTVLRFKLDNDFKLSFIRYVKDNLPYGEAFLDGLIDACISSFGLSRQQGTAFITTDEVFYARITTTVNTYIIITSETKYFFDNLVRKKELEEKIKYLKEVQEQTGYGSHWWHNLHGQIEALTELL